VLLARGEMNSLAAVSFHIPSPAGGHVRTRGSGDLGIEG
jgi:hypothetical protein